MCILWYLCFGIAKWYIFYQICASQSQHATFVIECEIIWECVNVTILHNSYMIRYLCCYRQILNNSSIFGVILHFCFIKILKCIQNLAIAVNNRENVIATNIRQNYCQNLYNLSLLVFLINTTKIRQNIFTQNINWW